MPEVPIPLRLHHLANLQDAMNVGTKKYFQRFRAQVSLDGLSRKRGSNPAITFTDYDYYKDTVGPSHKFDKFIQQNHDAFMTYLSMGDGESLDLIAKGKDLICDTCHVGNHCLNEFHYESEASIALRLQDSIIAYELIGVFKQCGSVEEKNFHVITTMGLIRQILQADPQIMSY